MPIVSGPPWALSEDDMQALLADFACWLTNPWASERLALTSMEQAAEFLREGRTFAASQASMVYMTPCDLCGLQIPIGARRHRETWTGDNLLLCHDCYEHQHNIVLHLGRAAYREQWHAERENEVGLG